MNVSEKIQGLLQFDTEPGFAVGGRVLGILVRDV